MPIYYHNEIYTILEINKAPDIVFVFGDNVVRQGRGGQAIIRGLPNTFGIPTKWYPDRFNTSMFTDKNPECYNIIMNHLKALECEYLQRGITVAWPVAGIGTGLANWQRFAPMLLATTEHAVAQLMESYPI